MFCGHTYAKVHPCRAQRRHPSFAQLDGMTRSLEGKVSGKSTVTNFNLTFLKKGSTSSQLQPSIPILESRSSASL